MPWRGKLVLIVLLSCHSSSSLSVSLCLSLCLSLSLSVSLCLSRQWLHHYVHSDQQVSFFYSLHLLSPSWNESTQEDVSFTKERTNGTNRPSPWQTFPSLSSCYRPHPQRPRRLHEPIVSEHCLLSRFYTQWWSTNLTNFSKIYCNPFTC
jgi:hypothetical protein